MVNLFAPTLQQSGINYNPFWVAWISQPPAQPTAPIAQTPTIQPGVSQPKAPAPQLTTQPIPWVNTWGAIIGANLPTAQQVQATPASAFQKTLEQPIETVEVQESIVSDKLSIDDFAQSIKDKNPQYADVDNKLLTEKVIEKYPVYKDKVDILWELNKKPQEIIDIEVKPAGERTKEEQIALQEYRNKWFIENFNLGTNLSQAWTKLFGTVDVSEDIEKWDWASVWKKALRNAPASLVNTFGWLADMLLNPWETLWWLSSIFLWLWDLITGKETEESATVKAIWWQLAEFKDPKKIIEYAAEDPIWVITLVSPKTAVKWLQLAVKPFSVAGKVWGKVIVSSLWKTTWAGVESIEQAIKSAWNKWYLKWLRWDVAVEDILQDVKQWLNNIKDQRKLLYWDDYKKLEKVKSPVDISNVRKDFVSDITSRDWLNVKIDKKWNFDFSQSKITDAWSQNAIKEMYDSISSWELVDPVWLDILKQRIQDFYRWTPASSRTDALSTKYSNMIKDKIVKEVPEYSNMTKKYQELSNTIKEIEKWLSLWTKVWHDPAVKKLQSIFRDNQEYRKSLVDLVEQYAGKDIQAKLAWIQLNPYLSRGIMWPLIAGWWLYALSFATVAWLIKALPLFSPRLIWELANILWVSKNKITQAIDNIKAIEWSMEALRASEAQQSLQDNMQ